MGWLGEPPMTERLAEHDSNVRIRRAADYETVNALTLMSSRSDATRDDRDVTRHPFA
jgi:hypothetical protein